MSDVFVDTLHSWQNFYFMIGGAAAGLMGLMFVALSLGTHLVNDATIASFPTFVTPSIVYFVSALLVSGVMLVPALTPPALGLLLFLGGVVGLGRTLQNVLRLIQVARKNQDFNIWDWLTQIILPVVSYVVILLAGLGFVGNQWSLAFMGVWLATLLLLICAIANTWGVVLWIVEQRRT
jgi:hypothetical protein